MVQHAIADMVVEIEAARLMVRRLGWLMDRGLPSSREASQTKYLASRVAKSAAEAAAEIFGGYAFADDSPVRKFKAYVDMLNVGEGVPNVQRVLIAEDALGYKDANRHTLKTRSRI
jgi:isovaleryl-CoA dehydrogenase